MVQNPFFLASLKRLFREEQDDAHVEGLYIKCMLKSASAASHLLLVEAFGDRVLCEYTYAGRALHKGGEPNYSSLKGDTKTKAKLELVRSALMAHSPNEVNDRSFAAWVNYACQQARAQRLHCYDSVSREYRVHEDYGLRGSLFTLLSKSMNERFEQDVKNARSALRRRLDAFRTDLSEATDEEAEQWNRDFASGRSMAHVAPVRMTLPQESIMELLRQQDIDRPHLGPSSTAMRQ